jgi:hypothetical protein
LNIEASITEALLGAQESQVRIVKVKIEEERLCLDIHTHTCTHTYSYTHTYSHAHTYTHIHTHILTRTHIYTHTYTHR